MFDHAEGFEELKAEGVITEYYIFGTPGRKYSVISSSGDRVGSFTVQADSLDELREKHAEAIKRVKAVSTAGEDIIRHDLVTELNY